MVPVAHALRAAVLQGKGRGTLCGVRFLDSHKVAGSKKSGKMPFASSAQDVERGRLGVEGTGIPSRTIPRADKLGCNAGEVRGHALRKWLEPAMDYRHTPPAQHASGQEGQAQAPSPSSAPAGRGRSGQPRGVGAVKEGAHSQHRY